MIPSTQEANQIVTKTDKHASHRTETSHRAPSGGSLIVGEQEPWARKYGLLCQGLGDKPLGGRACPASCTKTEPFGQVTWRPKSPA